MTFIRWHLKEAYANSRENLLPSPCSSQNLFVYYSGLGYACESCSRLFGSSKDQNPGSATVCCREHGASLVKVVCVCSLTFGKANVLRHAVGCVASADCRTSKTLTKLIENAVI